MGQIVEELGQLCAGFGSVLEQANAPLPARSYRSFVDQALQACVMDGFDQRAQGLDLAEGGRRIVFTGVNTLQDMQDLRLDCPMQRSGLLFYLVPYRRIAE